MKALSSNHYSHDQQVADVLAWLRAEHPGDYAAIVDRFPEIPTAIFDGAWYDYELMGVDVEWSSWLTCVLEDTGLVQWEEGEPWAIPAPPTDDAVRLAHGHPGPLRWGPERHEWGPVEHATMTGTPHRKCIYCRAITLDLDEVEA